MKKIELELKIDEIKSLIKFLKFLKFSFSIILIIWVIYEFTFLKYFSFFIIPTILVGIALFVFDRVISSKEKELEKFTIYLDNIIKEEKNKKQRKREQEYDEQYRNFNNNQRSYSYYDDFWGYAYKNYEQQQKSNQNNSNQKTPEQNIAQNIKNAYELFKIDIKSTPEQIKKKYRELAILYHPDKYANDVSKRIIAERNFKKLNSAYNLIKKDKGII